MMFRSRFRDADSTWWSIRRDSVVALSSYVALKREGFNAGLNQFNQAVPYEATAGGETHAKSFISQYCPAKILSYPSRLFWCDLSGY